MLGVVAARCHWDCMLWWYVEVVVIWRCSGGSSAIYTIARCATWDHNILTILERCCYICTHHIRIANLRIILNHHIAVHIVLSTLVWAVRVWRMVRVVCWSTSNYTWRRICIDNWSCIVLISLWRKIVSIMTTGALSSIGLIILFSRLWTDASETAKSWTTFAWIVVMISMCVGISNWASSLINDLVRAQMWIGRWMSCMPMDGMVHVGMSNVGLSKLIKDWSWSLGINSWDLRHDLTVVIMRAFIIIIFSSCWCFCRAYFLSAVSLWMTMIPILTLVSLVWRTVVQCSMETLVTIL